MLRIAGAGPRAQSHPEHEVLRYSYIEEKENKKTKTNARQLKEAAT
jgi:hypothetical protein